MQLLLPERGLGRVSIRAHTAYNLLGALLPIGMSLLTIPIYIRLIGDARYGVLAVVWAFLGYFGMFDLGLGRATAQRIAALGDATPERIAATFWTALAMNGFLGILGGILIWPVSKYAFGNAISMDADLRTELLPALPWLVLAVPLTTLSGVFGGALQGRAQFRELNLISVTASFLGQTIPLLVAWLHGPDLAWILPAVILTRLFASALVLWRCKVHVFHGQLPSFAREQAKGLLQFGGWVTMTAIVGPLMVVLDRFVIGAMVGARSVTYYTVPFQLAERSTVLAGALTTAMFPRFAAARVEDRRRLATNAILALAAAMTPLILTAILFAEPFFRLWINGEFAENVKATAGICLLGFWFNGLARVPYSKLQAAGRPDLVAKCHVMELPPYLLLLFLGLKLSGLPGAAAAFSLRVFADFVLLLWFAGILETVAAGVAFPAILLFAGFAVAMGFSVGSSAWWAVTVPLLALAVTWSAWSAPVELRESAMRQIRSLPLFKPRVSQ